VADIFNDAKTRVSYVLAIANLSAPSAATELNAGTSLLLQSLITPDGLIGFEASTADVDNSALDSTFDTVGLGRISFSGTTLRLKKQTVGADTAYTTFVYGVTGFIVIRRYLLSSTAWANGDKVSVFPIAVGEPKDLAPTKNTVAMYEVPLKITSTPATRATVAA
jgi:hypothetical protein